jgi:hypothetical protein
MVIGELTWQNLQMRKFIALDEDECIIVNKCRRVKCRTVGEANTVVHAQVFLRFDVGARPGDMLGARVVRTLMFWILPNQERRVCITVPQPMTWTSETLTRTQSGYADVGSCEDQDAREVAIAYRHILAHASTNCGS